MLKMGQVSFFNNAILGSIKKNYRILQLLYVAVVSSASTRRFKKYIKEAQKDDAFPTLILSSSFGAVRTLSSCGLTSC